MFANVHSGKFRLDVEAVEDPDLEQEAEDDELLGMPYSTGPRECRHEETPEMRLFQSFDVQESIIKGMQIYSPFTRNTSRKRVDNGHENMVRFPLRLTQLLIEQEFYTGSLNKTKQCQADVMAMMEWVEEHLNHYKEQLATLINAPTRVEFFLQYQENLNLARENLNEIPNLAFCLRKVKTKELARHLTSQMEDCMGPLRMLVQHMRIHSDDNNAADFSGFSREAKAGLIITGELLIALLDFHPYQPWHLKTFMALDGRKHGAWCIPQRFHVQLSRAECQLTGLRYGVDPKQMKRKIPFVRRHEQQIFNAVKATTMSKSYAFLIRKNVRISLFYVQAIEKLQATLQYYSAEREGVMLTTVPSPVSRAAAENPGFDHAEQNPGLDHAELTTFPSPASRAAPENPGSEHAELLLLEEIDYPYLANNLTSERRIQMFQYIGEIASDLYQQNWHDLLTSKKYAQDQEPIPIDDFPKSKSPFVDLMMGIVPTAEGLNWGFHEINNKRIIIKTPSKSIHTKS
jgi:hypothetical protein